MLIWNTLLFSAMKIHVSQYAKAALDEFPEYHLQLRGQTEVKVIIEEFISKYIYLKQICAAIR